MTRNSYANMGWLKLVTSIKPRDHVESHGTIKKGNQIVGNKEEQKRGNGISLSNTRLTMNPFPSITTEGLQVEIGAELIKHRPHQCLSKQVCQLIFR